MSSPARGRGGARGKGRGGSRSANNSDDESVRQSARRTRANNAARTPSSIGLGRGAGRGLQGALGQVRSPAAPKRGNQSTRGNAAQSNGPSQGGFGVSTSRSANRIAPSVAERLKTVCVASFNLKWLVLTYSSSFSSSFERHAKMSAKTQLLKVFLPTQIDLVPSPKQSHQLELARICVRNTSAFNESNRMMCGA